jgi:hypothetical protein
MERVVADKILDYVLGCGVITKHQHGFLKHRSTQTQMLECLNSWTSLIDKNEYVDVLYVDIAKAFDTVSHCILIGKLHAIGIRGKILAWIKQFLNTRTQNVRVGSCMSGPVNVTSGVPQGSVLGPLLFLLFINDLVEVVNNSDIKIFADDTKMYFKVRRDHDFDKFVYDARKIFGWADKNGLKIAMHKCQVLHIGEGNPSRDVLIDGVLLDPPLNVKDLGVIMSATLSFQKHIQEIVTATYRRTGMIFRCFKSRDADFLKQMFIAFCRPKLEFNCCVWSPHHLGLISQIENVQRRYTKRIPDLQNLPYAERLKRLGMESLEYRRLISDLCMVYSICYGLVDLSFSEFFVYANGRTRGHNLKLAHPYARTDTRKFFFANRVVPVWNQLTSEVVNAVSLNSFKKLIRQVDLSGFLKHPALADES